MTCLTLKLTCCLISAWPDHGGEEAWGRGQQKHVVMFDLTLRDDPTS